MAHVQDCDIVVSEFELQLRYYVQFHLLKYKHTYPLVPLLFFCKDGFGIK